ncbi:jg19408 [Pararge aegeria aegeria]|uniref:Jg19408 protein n=1 Tax=Pararge aegeria aegeria TaxID=348720 RepID=A0A8S4R6P2_9NEOP|nr:jg19408 [Pararge aegeria aegeria]
MTSHYTVLLRCMTLTSRLAKFVFTFKASDVLIRRHCVSSFQISGELTNGNPVWIASVQPINGYASFVEMLERIMKSTSIQRLPRLLRADAFTRPKATLRPLLSKDKDSNKE